jgi:glutathione S-transferase
VTKCYEKYEIPQSKAIERYLARKFGFLGRTDEDAALIDSICELVVDIKNKFVASRADPTAAEKYLNTTLPLMLGFIVRYIERSRSGYCVGDALSLADIAVYNCTTSWFQAEHNVDVSPCLPTEVRALNDKVLENKGIAEWVSGRATRGDAF